MSRWLTLEQASEYTQVSIMTLRREIKSGALRCVKVGGRKCIRFRPEWLDQWLEGVVA